MHDAATQIAKTVVIAFLCQLRVLRLLKLHKRALPMNIDQAIKVMNFSVEFTATEWLKDAKAGIRKQSKSFPSSLVSLWFCVGRLVIRLNIPRIVKAVLAIFWYWPCKGVQAIKSIEAQQQSQGR